MIKDKIYLKCSDMPLYNFMKVMFEDDFSFLIKKRGVLSVGKNNLSKIWEAIKVEYYELNDNEGISNYFLLLKQKVTLQNKLYLIQSCIDGLAPKYNIDLVRCLKKLGFNFKFSKESYLKDLEKVVAKSKPIVIRIKNIDRQIAPFLQGEEVTRQDFEELIADVSKFQGYRISPKETSVLEFITVLNNYKKWLTTKKSTK